MERFFAIKLNPSVFPSQKRKMSTPAGSLWNYSSVVRTCYLMKIKCLCQWHRGRNIGFFWKKMIVFFFICSSQILCSDFLPKMHCSLCTSSRTRRVLQSRGKSYQHQPKRWNIWRFDSWRQIKRVFFMCSLEEECEESNGLIIKNVSDSHKCWEVAISTPEHAA